MPSVVTQSIQKTVRRFGDAHTRAVAATVRCSATRAYVVSGLTLLVNRGGSDRDVTMTRPIIATNRKRLPRNVMCGVRAKLSCLDASATRSPDDRRRSGGRRTGGFGGTVGCGLTEAISNSSAGAVAAGACADSSTPPTVATATHASRTLLPGSIGSPFGTHSRTRRRLCPGLGP